MMQRIPQFLMIALLALVAVSSAEEEEEVILLGKDVASVDNKVVGGSEVNGAIPEFAVKILSKCFKCDKTVFTVDSLHSEAKLRAMGNDIIFDTLVKILTDCVTGIL